MSSLKIKPVQMFPCPLTGKLFKTIKGAEKSAEKEQKRLDAVAQANKEAAQSQEEKLKLKDYIRLNLKDVKDLPRMLTEKAKEFCGITITDLKINVSFGQVSNSHGCPLDGKTNWSSRDPNLPTSYLGWSGNITMKATKALSEPDSGFNHGIGENLFSPYYNKGFRGFHTGTGCGGKLNDYAMDIGFYFFLDDFPLLKEKHADFLIEKEKFIKNKQARNTQLALANDFADSHKEVTELDEKIAELQKERTETWARHNTSYLAQHPPVLETQSPDFEWLTTQFVGIWSRDWLNEY